MLRAACLLACLLAAPLGGCNPAREGKLRAQALLGAQDLPAARVEARRVIAARPHDPDGYFLLARIEVAAGRLAAAIEPATMARRCAPDRADIDHLLAELLLRRGRALAELGHVRASRHDVEVAVRLDPALCTPLAATLPHPTELAQAAASAAMPLALAAGGETPAAEARAPVPKDVAQIMDWAAEEPAWSRRGPLAVRSLEAANAKVQAIWLQDRIVAEDPFDAAARLELARLLLSGGRAERAEQEIDDAIWAASDRVATMRRAADLLERAGRRRKACSLLGRALAFGADADRLRTLGECLQRDGQTAEAREILDRACAADPACHAAAR